MKLNIVPVVRGPANYSHLVPPNSVINARDFSSPKELAEYLRYLDAHHSKYMEYFQWKRFYGVHDNGFYFSELCDLCKFLNKPHQKVHTVPDVKQWFAGKSDCDYTN